MTTALERLNNFTDWFIPADIASDRENRKQARMFLYSHIFGPFIGNSVPLALYLFDPHPGYDIGVLALAISAFWIYPFILRWFGNYNVLAIVSVQNLIFAILWSCYFHGGVTSPTLPWVLTIPLLAFFYVGPSAKMRTIVLSQFVVSLVTFYFLYRTTAPGNGGISLGATQALGLVSTTAASLYVTMMALFYANALASQVELAGEMREHQITASELRQATEEAQKAGAAKSDFLAKMSHELRTPLNAVIGYSEILMEDAVDENDVNAIADLKKIHGAGHYLLKLVNEVLDLSKIEAGKMDLFVEASDGAELLKKLVASFETAARERGNEISLDLKSPLGTLYTDAAKLTQAVSQLVDNAIKFTVNGKISVEAERRGPEATQELILRVRDTGKGIASEKFANLFEQFSVVGDTSETKYGGTGLGLALSKKLSRLLGGDLEVSSEVGVGSCFSMCIPANASDVFPVSTPSSDVESALRAAEAGIDPLKNVINAVTAGDSGAAELPQRVKIANA